MSILSRLFSFVVPRKSAPLDTAQQFLGARFDVHALQQTADLFKFLNEMKSAGLLYYDFRVNVVTIAQVLAEHFIYEDKDWQDFLHKCNLWASFQYGINEYNKKYNKVFADAEAAAYAEKNSKAFGTKPQDLTRAERRAARAEAASRFDAENAGCRALIMPDVQFVVLGAYDRKPIIVARFIDGVLHTDVVPDEVGE